jgi:hypothetical protein
MNKLEFDKDTNNWIFACPWCNTFIVVASADFNCQIFRHGCYKASGEPINPHSTKEQCENFLNSGVVNGCCKPFQIINVADCYYATCCEYI